MFDKEYFTCKVPRWEKAPCSCLVFYMSTEYNLFQLATASMLYYNYNSLQRKFYFYFLDIVRYTDRYKQNQNRNDEGKTWEPGNL